MPDISTTIFEEMKKELITLAVKPGERISEAEICDRFSVMLTHLFSQFWIILQPADTFRVWLRIFRAAYVSGQSVFCNIFQSADSGINHRQAAILCLYRGK